MGLGQSKDLDYYEKGRKKIWNYMIQKKKKEKSWVSHEVKIWIVMKREEKRWCAQSKDLNCFKKGGKMMGFGLSKDLDCY